MDKLLMERLDRFWKYITKNNQIDGNDSIPCNNNISAKAVDKFWNDITKNNQIVANDSIRGSNNREEIG